MPSAECPLSEYPRPQLRRESYLCLNGEWDFYMGTDPDVGEYPDTILVPYSPETELSGVCRKKEPGETLRYRRFFTLPEGFNVGRVLLHFGACDCETEVFLNGASLGAHRGGYWPFSFDITEHLKENNELVLTVRDEAADSFLDARGKQTYTPQKTKYPATSGLWQTVWLESVPEQYIESVTVTPLYDKATVFLTVHSENEGAVSVSLEGFTYAGAVNRPMRLPVPEFTPWSPENPKLYPFTVNFYADTVTGYFAMRKMEVKPDGEGVPRIFLNNAPYFCTGLLDQGYYKGGAYTPASFQEMAKDIEVAKALGFNTLRKHAKIEPLLWYNLCDTLGMLVFQDMVNGGGPYKGVDIPVILPVKRNDSRYKRCGRATKESRSLYRKELDATVQLLYNTPSVVLYTLFNEGWGQFDALKAVSRVRKQDDTRLIDHASGWFDQKGGDIQSRHVYFLPPRMSAKKGEKRALCLTEFGGYSYSRTNKKGYGYRRFTSSESLTNAVARLYRRFIIPGKRAGLSAAIYTQLTDCYQEDNGLLTAARRLKVDPEVIQALNARLTEQK